jgi:N-sulfoglucosamine sulfohydrolase
MMKCILFVADAVRPDYLGCYGNPQVSTEAIDRLADGGVRFETAISAAPWTAPSMASIVSGIYAHKHQIFTWDRGFADSAYTLFHAFTDHQHSVGSFVFDQNYLFSTMPFASVQSNTEQFDAVLHWLRDHAQGDFLLLVHSWATHMPYNVHHSSRKDWKTAKELFIRRLQTEGEEAVIESRAIYQQAIEYCSQHQIARLIELLNELGIFEDTLFAFMSDHGESWGERFSQKAEIQGIHHLHGRFLYDETIRIPLIMHWPARLPSKGVVPTQVRSVDLAPTLFDLAGWSLPPSSPPMDGSSLLSLIEPADAQDRPAFSATSEYGTLSKISLRLPPHKFIYTLDDEQVELYDFDRDPGESVNLVERESGLAQRMRSQIEAELRNVPAEKLTSEEEEQLLDRLQQLGYL